MWSGSGPRPKGAGVTREAGSGRVGRRWPPGQAFSAPLETSESPKLASSPLSLK